jgi:hypothetical protein
MYSDEDLQSAIDQDIFTNAAVKQFKHHIETQRQVSLADEENFRLISGFNDIFVVIASGLLLTSIAWLGFKIAPSVGYIGVAVTSWLLAEFFVIKRRMALPAIALLLTFLGSVFSIPLMFNSAVSEYSFIIAGILTGIAALMHWRRFRVPITVAASVLAVSVSIILFIVGLMPSIKLWINPLLLITGLSIFMLAMYWDTSDPERTTRASDVAFWLHLTASPLIVHPIFSSVGVLHGVSGVYASIAVVAVYLILAIVSIAVDRRAIMVSALVYVIFAFSSLLQNYGMVSYSFAITGVCIGATLLLLSAFWHVSRRQVVRCLPIRLQKVLPSASE